MQTTFLRGGRLKFGDAVTAVASLIVLYDLFYFLLGAVLIASSAKLILVPALGHYWFLSLPCLGFYWGQNVTAVIAVFLSALIVDYILGKKILEEAKVESMAKTSVLYAVFMGFSVGIGTLSSDWTQMVKDAYLQANPNATLSASDWYVELNQVASQIALMNIVVVLVLGFIGLYLGSKIRELGKGAR
jgi:hypothetical protein